MLVLDTDVLSHIQNGGPLATRIRDRIAASGDTAFVTVVTLEEQLRGRLADCARANDPARYVAAARRLRLTHLDYQGRNLLDFDDAAAAVFRNLKAARVRIGTMDLRIAAIALAHDATLVTMNVRDYEQVPGLRFEDWSVG